MRAERPEPLLHKHHQQQHTQPYFSHPIPRIIHQIAFRGESSDPHWSAYAHQHNYQYLLWTPENDHELSRIMLPGNFTLMKHLRDSGNLISAEHILAYELLRAFGGIYAHTRLEPPSVDFSSLVPMRGAVFTTEKEGPSCGNSAIYLTPDLLLSSPGHPFLDHLTRTLRPNYESCQQHNENDPELLTGAYLLNRTAAGTYTILPPAYLAKFGTHIHLKTHRTPVNAADYDRRCAAMNAQPTEIPPQSDLEQAYFHQPIPKQVHQIWFGDPKRLSKAGPHSWKEYSATLGYTYRLWTEADDETVIEFMRPHNYLLMLEMRSRREYRTASDILRIELLREFGGIYADCDMGAPQDSGQWVDFAQLAPMQGLVLTTEWHLRHIDTSAIFVLNGLMLSCPHHPVLDHLSASIHTNYESWTRRKKVWDMYITGPFLMNKVLTGAVTLISPFDLGALGVWNP